MSSAALALDALGNPNRRAIVRALASGPMPVGAIAELLPISRPAVSQHLRLLEDAELVTHSSEGTRNLFRLHRAGFAAATRWLDSFWDEAMDNFAALAEESWKAEQ